MAIFTFDDALVNDIVTFSWGDRRNNTFHDSAFGRQGLEISAPIWQVGMETPPLTEEQSGAWKALIMNLKGSIEQLELWPITRPAPLGSMRGTMTLLNEALQGAISLDIVAAGEISKTLKAGDWLQLGSGLTQQVVMVMALSTANVSGEITVPIQPPLRNTHAAAASVVWDKPKALFRRMDSENIWERKSNIFAANNFDFLEDPRP